MSITIKNIKKYIKKNKGITLKGNKLFKANKGFAVSLYGFEKKSKILNSKTIKEYKNKAKKQNALFGVWFYDGVFYYDISKHYKTKKAAIKAGIKNKQIGIYDLKNNRTIKL